MYRSATITPAEFDATIAKIEAINARAAKKGLAGSLSITGTERTAKVLVGQMPMTTRVVDAVITGTAPAHAGWTFAARIDAVGEGIVVSSVAGAPSVDRDAVVAGACEHCHTARDRKVTYVLLGHGRQVQVGSTCINDFLGWDGTFSIFTETEARDEDFFGGGGVPSYDPESIIRVATAIVRTYGFVRTMDSDISTRDRVGMFCFGSDAASRELRAAVAGNLAEVTERAAATVAYIASEDFAGDSDYVANLKTLVAAQTVESRHFGLLASAPSAYTRHMGDAARRAAKGDSHHLGEVGAKIEVEATIASIRYIDGDYGTTYLYTLNSGDDVIKWFASRDALGHDEGVKVTIKATVKKHETYAGCEQTVITRAKAI